MNKGARGLCTMVSTKSHKAELQNILEKKTLSFQELALKFVYKKNHLFKGNAVEI